VGDPTAYQQVYTALRDAGYDEIKVNDEAFVSKVADAAISRLRQAEVGARTAAVVTADGPCPHCQSPMANATLSNGTPIRHCPKCRVSAYVVS
jgi:hypothetical protein